MSLKARLLGLLELMGLAVSHHSLYSASVTCCSSELKAKVQAKMTSCQAIEPYRSL